jgi:hypothetical protein
VLQASRPQRQVAKSEGAHVLQAAVLHGASQIEKLLAAQPAHCVSPHEAQIVKGLAEELAMQSVHERAWQSSHVISPRFSHDFLPAVQKSRCCAMIRTPASEKRITKTGLEKLCVARKDVLQHFCAVLHIRKC